MTALSPRASCIQGTGLRTKGVGSDESNRTTFGGEGDLDELGILKVDCLCLGMLTAIRKCFGLIEQHFGHKLTLASVPQEDPQVYKMARTSNSWLAYGKLERKGQVIHVVVNKIEDLSVVIGDWQVRSRDFH